MKSLFLAAAALVASTPLAASSHLAQRASSSAAPPATSSSVYSQQVSLCPEQDGQTITGAAGFSYKLYCDSYAKSPVFHVEAASMTDRECMAACDAQLGCLAAVSYDGNLCDLAVGGSVSVEALRGYTAIVRVNGSASAIPSAYTTTSAQPGSSPSVPVNVTVSSTSFTGTIASPLPTDTATNVCSFENIDCPACDGQSVTDENGNTYGVFCDYQVSADGNFPVDKNTSPQSCVEECDRHYGCLGATWHLEGNCELAIQGNATPIQMPGYTAFMPIAAATVSPTPISSWVPTVMPSPIDWDSTLTTSTVTATPSAASSTRTCAAADVSCPVCEGSLVTDLVGQEYLTLCYVRPVCVSTASPIGNFTADKCMEACDADATCLAAMFLKYAGSCDLCQYGINSTVVMHNPLPGYAFFLSAPAWQNGNLSASGLSSSADGAPSSAELSVTSTSSITTVSASSSQVSRVPPNTTSEQMFSILPFPVVTTTTTSSSSLEQMFSILPFPVETSTTGSISSEQMFSILPFPVETTTTASTNSQQMFSILPFPVETSTSSSSSDVPTSTPMSSVPAFPPTSFTAHTLTVSATPSNLADMSSVSCPAAQNTTAYDSTSDRAFQINCDSTIRAANHIIVAASDLDACAGLCSDGCDGVQYASQTCSLLAGITAMGHKRGYTAAVAVTLATVTEMSITITDGEGTTPAPTAASADSQTRVIITRTMT